MKTYYAVHKTDKTHVGIDSIMDFVDRFSTAHWALVEADSDGWIKHEGNECPLPDDVICEVKNKQGVQWEVGWMLLAGNFYWPAVSAYRPILAENVQEPEYDPRSVSFNLLDRLKAAHKAAQQIPDLEAELREVLGSMGYDLVARNPFVEAEADVKTPQDNKYAAEW